MLHSPQGMTMYVTLEPCCHKGKTPPCTDALIKAGIKKVIYGYRDPNPIVSGKGAASLINAGIACEHHSLSEINAFYESYYYWHQTQTPFVTAKIAISLDGKIAGKTGERIQLTGEPLQVFTHAHRQQSDAILTTSKTIKNDNPMLNVRHLHEIFSKDLYILDTYLTLPSDAIIFQTAKSITLFHGKQASRDNQQRLEKLNATCVLVDTQNDQLDLNQSIQYIGKKGVHDLWVEAGGTCFSSLLKNQLLQRLLIYIAPRWLGEGLPAFVDPLSVRPTHIHWQQVGNDGVLEMRLVEYPT